MIFNSPRAHRRADSRQPVRSPRRWPGPTRPDDLLERLKLVTNDEAWACSNAATTTTTTFQGDWPCTCSQTCR